MQAHRDLLGLAARARRETEGNLEQMAHLVQPDWEVPLVPLQVVWCTLGGGGPHVPALPEHSYCMLEELQEAILLREEEEQTKSAYQSSHNTPPTLLEHRVDELTCMGQSTRLVMGMKLDRWVLLVSTMSHAQFAMLQHEGQWWWFLHDSAAHHPGLESIMDISWQSGTVTIAECLNAWTNIHSQYQEVQQIQKVLCFTMLKQGVMEFPVHHTMHTRKSHVSYVRSRWLPCVYVCMHAL